ncbi:hypothetical protein HYE29_03185 [Mycoplasmopsis bovis]|nr:hypothetical protein [Mycoplasmopsis bovis]QQH22838.1 hypothetical protein HYE29_03185 [Mycoplasmopsis bovis]
MENKKNEKIDATTLFETFRKVKKPHKRENLKKTRWRRTKKGTVHTKIKNDQNLTISEMQNRRTEQRKRKRKENR